MNQLLSLAGKGETVTIENWNFTINGAGTGAFAGSASVTCANGTARLLPGAHCIPFIIIPPMAVAQHMLLLIPSV